MRYQNTHGNGPAEMHVVVVGGGVGGMAAALGLARAGRRVTVLERDDLSLVVDAESAFTARRSGAPQARQTHGLLARLTRVLRERFPDVLDELFARGATQAMLNRELGDVAPGDEELAILLVRRTTLELVLREAVQREPLVTFRSAAKVAGLVAETAPEPPVVVGVRLDDGEVVPADAVIASTGRRSEVTRWLAAIGVDVPEVVHDTNLVYLTRWYRFPESTVVELEPKMGGDLGYAKFLAVPGDGHTFSVTIAVPSADAELRSTLLDPDTFDAAARQLPGPGAVFARTALEPISGVEPMGGFVNRLRSFVGDDGAPRVLGFHAIGDAHTCTNPFYGRGCSIALMQATLLADAFDDHADDASARAGAFERASAHEVEPWFHDAVLMDAVIGVGQPVDPGAAAAPGPAGSDAGAVLGKVMAASETDPVIARGLLRVMNMLERPEQLTTDIEFATHVAMVLADPDAPTLPPPAGPTRGQMLGTVAA